MVEDLSSTLEMSKPTAKIVHGVEIKKMPLGAYIEFVKKGGRLVPIIIDKLFPGMAANEILTKIVLLRGEAMYKALVDIITEAPELAIGAIAKLVDVETDTLLNNPEIGPLELWDILEEWNELNNLTDFFRRANERFLLRGSRSQTRSEGTGINL